MMGKLKKADIIFNIRFLFLLLGHFVLIKLIGIEA